jgi:formylglycine-generating enzyme required for sulfatase activity
MSCKRGDDGSKKQHAAMRRWRGWWAVLIALTLSVSALAQQAGSLSVADIEKLLKSSVSPSRVAQLIDQRGVNFANSSAIGERLRNAGADVDVLLAVGKAAEKYASSKSASEQKKPEGIKQKPPEPKKVEEPKIVTRPPALAPLPPPPAGPSQRSGDDAEMVSVPAGEFWMGSEDSDAVGDEKPRRPVYLDAFLIDKYEVTSVLYKRFIDATGRAAPQFWTGSDQPVVGVNWNDANAYCSWAGKRLPTEAEWEKAARGTDGRKYPWGEQWDASRANSGERLGRTDSVGSYPGGVSPYGAHDMAGNALEWVADWFEANYYQSAPSSNPRGPDSGHNRVVRGGSGASTPKNLRTSARLGNSPSGRGSALGFRCAQ